MKIEGPRQTGGVSKSSSGARKTEGGSGFSSLLGSDGPGAARGPAGSSSIMAVDALLAAQAAEDVNEKSARKKARDRGDKLLSMLDNLRMRILSGNVTVGDMVAIADIVASHREKITDPELTWILDEIDLRAQIELAKLQMADPRAKNQA